MSNIQFSIYHFLVLNINGKYSFKTANSTAITAFRKQFVWAHCQLEPEAYSYYLSV